jgi:hypothetical protein
MKKIITIVAGIFTITFSGISETHLSDDIGGKILEPSGNPYIVDQDVVIAKNTKTVIKAGCVFLFKSFTGINIYGSMLVEGTQDDPVVFSSINDANYNAEATQLPNAFDWNGIYISEESGGVKLRNFRLMYSVFGIKSKKDDITIQNGYFKQNGQFHFTINDNIHYVQDNISYSYNVPEDKGPATAKPKPDTKSTQGGDEPEPVRTSKKGRGRRIAAFTTMGVGLACGIPTIITGIKASQYKSKAENADTPDDYKTYDDKFKSTRLSTIITGITCGCAIPISLFLFVKKDKSTVTKKVSLNVEAGMQRVAVGVTRHF